jgi:hypothetical protein
MLSAHVKPVHFYDLGLGDKAEHPKVRALRVRQHPEVCGDCLFKDGCPGVIGSYTAKFGTADFKPYHDAAAIAKAMERTGEPYPEVKTMDVDDKLDLITATFNSEAKIVPLAQARQELSAS